MTSMDGHYSYAYQDPVRNHILLIDIHFPITVVDQWLNRDGDIPDHSYPSCSSVYSNSSPSCISPINSSQQLVWFTPAGVAGRWSRHLHGCISRYLITIRPRKGITRTAKIFTTQVSNVNKLGKFLQKELACAPFVKLYIIINCTFWYLLGYFFGLMVSLCHQLNGDRDCKSSLCLLIMFLCAQKKQIHFITL